MDLSPATLVVSIIVSSVGFGLFVYGKKEPAYPQLLVGMALMGCTYLVHGALLLAGVAALLIGGLWVAVR